MYLIIALIIAAFTAGYGLSWKIGNKQIAVLEAQIGLANQEADRLQGQALLKTQAAETVAALTVNKLESERAQATQSAAALHVALAAVRLRDPGQRQHCPNPVPKSTNTREPETAADPGQLSKELSGFLLEQTYLADTVANYAHECHQFILTNCGIAP